MARPSPRFDWERAVKALDKRQVADKKKLANVKRLAALNPLSLLGSVKLKDVKHFCLTLGTFVRKGTAYAYPGLVQLAAATALSKPYLLKVRQAAVNLGLLRVGTHHRVEGMRHRGSVYYLGIDDRPLAKDPRYRLAPMPPPVAAAGKRRGATGKRSAAQPVNASDGSVALNSTDQIYQQQEGATQGDGFGRFREKGDSLFPEVAKRRARQEKRLGKKSDDNEPER